MLYIHDVWVNWFEGEENGYNICPFHEWRKHGDEIVLLDQVPVIYVENDLFDYIENQLLDLPDQLLQDIYNKALMRKSRYRDQLEYCFTITNGIDVLVVDTIGYRIPFKKSRMMPKQELEVVEMVKSAKPSYYQFKKERKEYHILSPSPKSMIGLTRKERELKKILFMALNQLFKSQSVAEMRYWYTEWNPARYEEIQQMSFEMAWRNLFKEIQIGWGKQHIAISEKLIRGQEYFEELWKIEYS